MCFGYLGNRLISPDAIDWNLASYALLARLAYTDIFGSVIGVQETAPEQVFVRQWQDASSGAQAALPLPRQGGAVGYRSLCQAGARRFFSR